MKKKIIGSLLVASPLVGLVAVVGFLCGWLFVLVLVALIVSLLSGAIVFGYGCELLCE